MVTVVVAIWVLLGAGVVLWGIKTKNKYGFRTHWNISALTVAAVSAVIWPLPPIMITRFAKEQEAAIREVLQQQPKYTREGILRGPKVWRDPSKFLDHK